MKMNWQQNIGVWIILITCLVSPPPCLAQPRSSLNQQLLTAAAEGDLATVKSLVAKGADINARDAKGETPLMHSAYGVETEIGTVLSSPDVAEWLLSKGAIADLQDKTGQTALLLVAKTDGGPQEGEESATDIVMMLIRRRVDVNHRDRQGHTALIWARRFHHWVMVRRLRKAGAKG